MNLFTYLWAKIFRHVRGVAVWHSSLDGTSRVHSGSAVVHTTIARYSYGGHDCTFFHADIGPFCSIASRVSIGGVAHPAHFVSTSPVFLSHRDSLKRKFAHHDYLPLLRTKIGADVWIGEGAFIKAGVCVGHGAIIGMGSVVTHDVPPYAIVAGNPAKLIRYRFDNAVIDKLLAIQWWEWSDSRLSQFGSYMNDPALFIQTVDAS